MNVKLLATAASLLVAPLYTCLASPVTQLVVFGDSLSDNGNAAAALVATGQPSLASMNYAPNAFTDAPTTTPSSGSGPVGLWIDQFASKLGVADPQPFFATKGAGTNYAFAGTNTSPGSNLSVEDAFDISVQVTDFLGGHPGTASPNALYVIWGGANDIFHGANGGTTAADNLQEDIKALVADGAKNFLWLNLPDLGATPRGVSQGAGPLTTQTTDFNNEYAADLAGLQGAGINVIGVNISTLFSTILAHPSAYGFADVKDAAQGLNVDPNTFLFWDTEHPTTAGDALVADAAYSAYLGTAGGSAVPEPLGAGLSVLGLVAVFAALRLRRKSALTN